MHVVAHGGAGPTDYPEPRQRILDNAVREASVAATPISAVMTAIAPLEASPRFNAGVGSAVQSDGRIRTDASIMADDLTFGAACGMEGVVHAIRVAEAVRTQTPHVLLAGKHATKFAEYCGIETRHDCWTERTRLRWKEASLDDASYADQLEAVSEHYGAGHDTVGAVASDGNHVAAGTSTGGRWLALAGRVGDVPQVGAGSYASSAGGVSTTGAGEDIARVTLAREAEREIANGLSADAAAKRALATFADAASGTAGLIALTPGGDVGIAYNSEDMQTAIARNGTLC